MTLITPANTYGFSDFVVSPVVGTGNYTTIQAAVNAASSGDTIYIGEGTYSEVVALKAGINLTSWSGNSTSSNVTITGGFTFSGSGNISISNITLQSDTTYSLSYTGSSAGSINFLNCKFNCTNNISIYFLNTSSSASVYLDSCSLILVSNASALLVTSGAPGYVYFVNCVTTNNSFNYNTLTIESTQIVIKNSSIAQGFGVSSSGSLTFIDSSLSALSTAISLGTASSASFINSQVYGNTNSSVQSVFTATAGCTYSFINTGVTSVFNFTPTFSGSGTVSYNSLYQLGANAITFGTSVLDYNSLLLGDVTANSISTSPSASSTSTLSLGSAYQNSLGYDVILTVYIAVASATAASILCGVGSTSTPTQQTIVNSITLAALNVIPVTVYLPADYYALISTSGVISASISGQQATAV
ncbi:MAG: hypothetical protein KGZ39_00250 [Simkania sp.]|nr:hypothetical protein [Simkania sp.]